MMPTVVFLTVRMQPGFGVAVVIQAISQRLKQRGVTVIIGCLEKSGDFDDLDVHHIPATAQAVQTLCEQYAASHVIAHASPFFELLPQLSQFSTWAWEHGDPDPDFFQRSRPERQAQIKRKNSAVYPNIDGVIAISDFVRAQIQWPAAQLIRNGWEHVQSAGLSDQDEPALALQSAPKQLRVGCLMRLGSGEERYKGGALYRQLATACPDAHFSLMGRGQAQDAARYSKAGIQVLRNASDAQRAAYLKQIDVFVSPSLWEGCNLPLLEAQAQGTPSLCFDTGAHPEYARLLCTSVADMSHQINAWMAQRELLLQQARHTQAWVRQRFSWDLATDTLLSTLLRA